MQTVRSAAEETNSADESGRGFWQGRLANLAACVFLVVTGLLIIVQSSQLGEPGRGTDPGAGGYPTLLAVILLGLALLLALQRGHSESLPKLQAGLRVLGVVVVLILYAFLLGQLGYIVSTTLTLFAGMLLMQARPVWRIALYAIVLSVGIFMLFFNVFGVSLPRGNVERLFS